jgi:hypothetical protein
MHERLTNTLCAISGLVVVTFRNSPEDAQGLLAPKPARRVFYYHFAGHQLQFTAHNGVSTTMAQIARVKIVQHDGPTSTNSVVTLYYGWDDGLPFIDLFHVNMGHFLQVVSQTVGFALRGLMSPDQQVIKLTARLWTAIDTIPFNVSPFEYTPPAEERPGVFDWTAHPAERLGMLPYAVFRLGSYGAEEMQGTPPRRARGVRAMCAREAVDNTGQIQGDAITAAVGIKDALYKRLDTDEFPVITLPGFTATPQRAKFQYVDEPLGPDPDATSNDKLLGSQAVHFTGFANYVRPVRKSNSDHTPAV